MTKLGYRVVYSIDTTAPKTGSQLKGLVKVLDKGLRLQKHDYYRKMTKFGDLTKWETQGFTV